MNVWILAARPKTLFASVSPVIMGTAMAYAEGRFHALSAFAALLGAVLIQIGTNFANDYFDYFKGADTHERLGPTRATQAGLVPPQAMKKAYMLTFALAIAVGVYLVWRGGWPVVAIGLVSILFGILYTATPLALGYTGLADLFVLIFFGPVAVAGTYYVQALSVNGAVILAGLAPGLFSVAILTVNNLRDIEQDRTAGKKTLAVRFGQTFAKVEYISSLVLACGIATFLVLAQKNHPYSLAVWLSLLFAIPAIKNVLHFREARMLNPVLATTGKLLFLFSLIFSAGWIL